LITLLKREKLDEVRMSLVTGKEGLLPRPLLPPPLSTTSRPPPDSGAGGGFERVMPTPGMPVHGIVPTSNGTPAFATHQAASASLGGANGPGSGIGVSAFRAVGSQLAVASPAVKPATSPLPCQGSPETGRRGGSSGRESISPTPSSTASESPPGTPTVPGPPQGRDAFSWPSHGAYDENRQLLGTEEESSEVGGSSDEEEEDKNVWVITKEQYSYYVTQFKAMQANPRGVIPGTQAKEFFEKSRLPIQELRQIWQLSDVTKDGCLSLEEFLTAMHLVVLRRNDIPLPEQLPLCLQPNNLRGAVIARHTHQKPLVGDHQTEAEGRREEGGEEVASPQSQMSSPGGPKPVKFDLSAGPPQDPSIVCPVPFRPSPDSPCLQSSEEDEGVTIMGRQSKKKREVEYEQLWNVEDRNSRRLSSSDDEDTEEEAPGLSSSPLQELGPVSLPHPARQESTGARTVLALAKKEGLPPAPPARPAKSHARSSSLDLQAYKRGGTLPSLPSVPPRSSPFFRAQHSFEPPAAASNTNISTSNTTSSREEAKDLLGRDTREISAEIHKYKESVALLSRTLAELGQEVNDTLEERVVLEYQLDQLKAIGTGGD